MSLSNRQILIVFCYPDIASVQRLLNYSASLSDYANQRYWPSPVKPEMKPAMELVSFRGAAVAEVDVNISLNVVNISELGSTFAVGARSARSVCLADFKTDDSFVLLGSPCSQPSGELFEESIDLSFKFDPIG
jgi:hypothetical protein